MTSHNPTMTNLSLLFTTWIPLDSKLPLAVVTDTCGMPVADTTYTGMDVEDDSFTSSESETVTVNRYGVEPEIARVLAASWGIATGGTATSAPALSLHGSLTEPSSKEHAQVYCSA
eukprot:3188635-Rhodomonas_salina.1